MDDLTSLNLNQRPALSNVRRTGRLLLAAALLSACPILGRAQLPGTVVPTFAPTVRTNGSVAVIARQADGKLLIGGDFSRFGTVQSPDLVRLNTDGSVDAGFTAPAGLGTVAYVAARANGQVFVLYIQPANFTSLYELVRLNADGSQDASFVPPSFHGSYDSGEIRAFVVAVQPDGKPLVGGEFVDDPTSSATTSTVRRYNLDGSPDASFQFASQLTGYQVNSVLPLANGQTLVSGTFTAYSSSTSTGYSLIRLNADGSLDPSYPVDPTQVERGYDLTLQPDGKLLYLTDSPIPDADYGGVPRRLNADGSVDASFALPFTHHEAFVSLVLQADGKIVVGGAISTGLDQNNTETAQLGVARVNADGSLDATFQPAAPLVSNGDFLQIAALGVLPNGQILVGGTFKNFAGLLRLGLGSLNADGSTNSSFAEDLTDIAQGYAVAVQSGGQPLLAASAPLIDGTLASNLVGFAADGSLATVFAANLTDGQVYSTGASYTTTTPILALQADGKALLTGLYEPANGFDDANVERFNADGSLDAGFKTDGLYGYSVFKVVAPQADGHLYIAGNISSGYERTTYPLNRLNADGSVDTAFAPANDPGTTEYRGSTIYALAVQPDGKVLAGGAFLSVNGQAQTAVLRFNVDGSVDTGFNAVPTVAYNSVDALALQPDGKVVLSGTAFDASGAASVHLIRLNPDGSMDASFGSSTTDADGAIETLILQPDGKILLGGTFTTINGVSLPGVARLAANGAVDPQFTPGTGTNGTGGVRSLALTADGKVFAAGDFTQFNGQAHEGVVELYGGDIPPAPVITSGGTAAGQAGVAFTYQVAASNQPTGFAATGLPAGLSISAATGLIGGTPGVAGTFAVTLSATNLGGTGSATLTLTLAPATPTVTLTATTSTVVAGTDVIGEFTLNLSAVQDHDVIVNLMIEGSAVNGTDYVLLKMTKKIKAGRTSKPVTITPLGDGDGTGVKRVVTLLLAPGDGYNVGTTGKVKVKIFGR